MKEHFLVFLVKLGATIGIGGAFYEVIRWLINTLQGGR